MFIHSHILSKTIVTRIQTEIGEVYTRFHIKTTHKLNHTLKGRHILIRQILGSTFPSPPPPKGSSLWRRDNQWMLLGGAKQQLLVSYKRSLKLTRPGVGLGGGGGGQSTGPQWSSAVLLLIPCSSYQRALFEALNIPMVGGSAESRYLSMDKLKTRSVLQAYNDVSCAEGVVLKKGTYCSALILVEHCSTNAVRISLKSRNVFQR